MFNFDTFKRFLILSELGKYVKLGKFGRKLRQMANLPAQLELKKKSINCIGDLDFDKFRL